LTFLPGSTAKIQWQFLEDVRNLRLRSWRFTSGDGSREQIARILGDEEPRIWNSSLPGVAIEKPATLVLKNIDLKNNGTYIFTCFGFRGGESSDVVVFVAGK
jgi:hypothetical protein